MRRAPVQPTLPPRPKMAPGRTGPNETAVAQASRNLHSPWPRPSPQTANEKSACTANSTAHTEGGARARWRSSAPALRPLKGRARHQDPGGPHKMAPAASAATRTLGPLREDPARPSPTAVPRTADRDPGRQRVTAAPPPDIILMGTGPTHLPSPHCLRADRGAARVHGLAHPQGSWRPAAPPAQDGHARSSTPTSSSRSSRRLHRASACISLSGSPQRRGSSAGQSAAELPTPGPSPRLWALPIRLWLPCRQLGAKAGG
ncbi:uncharacterized protein AAEQ78_013919 [Lycaon pictus]